MTDSFLRLVRPKDRNWTVGAVGPGALSPFTGQRLIPPDGPTVIDGFRLTPGQYTQVRARNARVLAQHACSGEITGWSPVTGIFILAAEQAA